MKGRILFLAVALVAAMLSLAGCGGGGGGGGGGGQQSIHGVLRTAMAFDHPRVVIGESNISTSWYDTVVMAPMVRLPDKSGYSFSITLPKWKSDYHEYRVQVVDDRNEDGYGAPLEFLASMKGWICQGAAKDTWVLLDQDRKIVPDGILVGIVIN